MPAEPVSAESASVISQSAEDDYLIALLREARTDQLAGRIVLERILPALCALSRRFGGRAGGPARVMDDLIGTAWVIIRTYPIERRPRRVVSNLVRDIGFQTVIRPSRRRSAGEIRTADFRGLDRAVEPRAEPLDELVALLVDARARGLSDSDLGFVVDLVNAGHPRELAVRRSVSERTIRNHRAAVVRRLRYLDRVTAAA
jgi:hypothetical protein